MIQTRISQLEKLYSEKAEVSLRLESSQWALSKRLLPSLFSPETGPALSRDGFFLSLQAEASPLGQQN